MSDAKKPLSVRVPESIHRKLRMLAGDTGQSISEVAVSLLAAGVGEDAATPGDRLMALEAEVSRLIELEAEVSDLRGKLRSLASS